MQTVTTVLKTASDKYVPPLLPLSAFHVTLATLKYLKTWFLDSHLITITNGTLIDVRFEVFMVVEVLWSSGL
jgi:hypothetical protein